MKTLDEKPLGDIKGIGVDKEGNIYCGMPFYSRIQIYDNKGKFLYSLNIDAAEGDLRVKVQSDELWIATTRNNTLYILGNDGQLIKKEPSNRSYDEFGDTNEKRVFDNHNNEYVIKNPLSLFPHVVKISAKGEQISLI